MAKNKTPRWVKESREQIDKLSKHFRDNLSRIAIRFAIHRRADSIDAVHVEEAFESLIRLGLKQDPWWKRPQLKITAGAFFIGLAVSFPDFAPLLFDDANKQLIFTSTVIISSGFMGGVFYLWGWFRV